MSRIHRTSLEIINGEMNKKEGITSEIFDQMKEIQQVTPRKGTEYDMLNEK